MDERIAYCQECGREYFDVMNKYGEKCDCGHDLDLAIKVTKKEYSCIRLQGRNITK